MNIAIPQINPDVADVMNGYPAAIRAALMQVRELIFATAADEGVGPLTETLKWGEPAYLTDATKAGSTIRLGWKANSPAQYAIYFNCRTTLVDTFRTMFADDLEFAGNRAIILDEALPLPRRHLRLCIAMALTYHRTKS